MDSAGVLSGETCIAWSGVRVGTTGITVVERVVVRRVSVGVPSGGRVMVSLVSVGGRNVSGVRVRFVTVGLPREAGKSGASS